MKVTFIQPSMFKGTPSDCMEPLAFAVLKSLTPAHIKTEFLDERIESIPKDISTDAVALSVGTFTARRAYQIAQEYRKRAIPVIAGGFHPTLCPEEASGFVDCIAIGDSEDTWPQIITDLEKGALRKEYKSYFPSMTNSSPDRSIFSGKKYVPVKPVQFSRGCVHCCDFCSIHSFYGRAVRERSSWQIANELEPLRRNHILFTDDNLLQNKPSAEQLLSDLKESGVKWSCQTSLDTARSDTLPKLMAESGCKSVTIGFESLNPANLSQMDKYVNYHHQKYSDAIKIFHDQGIMVYGTFLFGYDFDTPDVFQKTLEFALDNQLYLANFNPLTPFPGTRLHTRLKKEKRLVHHPWWLNENYRYGQVSFRPRLMSARVLEEGCYWMRTEFNKHNNIVTRLIKNKTNRKSMYHAAIYLSSNLASKKEIHRKQNAQLGQSKPQPSEGMAKK